MSNAKVTQLLAKLQGVQREGDGWAARCPAHEDRRASLSINEADNGGAVIHCHAGCTPAAVTQAVALTLADLMPDKEPPPRQPLGRIVATYPYRDERGQLLFEVVRYDPKAFRPRCPDGAGGWTFGLNGARRVPYRLDMLYADRPPALFIVEGERDVDALKDLGVRATTNAGGAGKWRDDYTRTLSACGVQRVCVLADNDEAGRTHAQQVAASCHDAGFKVRVLHLPDLPAKGDVSDWIAAGGTRERLFTLAQDAPLWTPSTTTVPSALPSQPRAETPASRGTGAPTQASAAARGSKGEKRKQGREVEFEEPELWPQPVDGVALLDAIAATFSRYLALPSHASVALSLWVVHAYAFTAWFATPFLAITSPEKRCGKTILLIVVGALVPRRMFASNVTPAVLFRAIEKYKPTLLIDEADTFVRDNEELRGVLNSGHTRTTATVIRAVGDDHDPRAFSTWCPKAIALIGKLPGTLDDRSVEIRMRRRTAREHVERLRQDRIDQECQSVRRQALRWADDQFDALQEADPEVPDALHDRAADCWRPLLAVADAAGGRWPTVAREAALALSGTPDEEAASTRLLRDIREVFAEADDPEVMASTVILEKLVALEDRPWREWSHGRPLSGAKLANMLKSYGVLPAGVVRIGNKTPRGYRRDTFREAWDRYLDDTSALSGGLEAQQRNNANDSGPESAISKCNIETECCTLRSATNPMNTDACCAVAVQDPLEEHTRSEQGEQIEAGEGHPYGRF